MMKKGNILFAIVMVLVTVGVIYSFVLFVRENNELKVVELPKPEVSEGMRGELGIDKNINEATIDEYLGREDSVYRDMRLLEDPAEYEAIEGDSYLSGFVRGFEVIPFPYLVNVTGLPKEVGDTYKGKTLFTLDKNGKYVANYEESMAVLEYLFPKDKNIFLMCGGGGYAGMTKAMLVSLGWDENKIYNTGGYWYYEGENAVIVKNDKYKDSYDFWKVPYHNINFKELHEVK
jgi:rhodanese-related sulfurtransferase